MTVALEFRLNGQPKELEVEKTRSLLWVLRTDLGLTGTKYGCGTGLCGSCTVLIDGKPVRSCTSTVGDVVGSEVITVEGLEKDGALHPVQAAFAKHGGFQCGFCTPGMIMSAVGLLKRNPTPSRDQIVRGMNGNLCRCGAHVRIIRAIQEAATNLNGVRR